MGNFDAIKYKNDYTKEKYDRINFTAPKGFKELISVRAGELGYKNIGQYIKAVIEKDLGRGTEIIPKIKLLLRILRAAAAGPEDTPIERQVIQCQYMVLYQSA